MAIDPNALASSGAVALTLSLVIIGAFVSGTIVSGKMYDRLMVALDRLTAALETQNRLTELALKSRNERA